MSDILMSLTNDAILSWYVYGIMLSYSVWLGVGLHDWYAGRDFTIEDILVVMVSSCLSWMFPIIVVGAAVLDVLNDKSRIIIKGRKQPKKDGP